MGIFSGLFGNKKFKNYDELFLAAKEQKLNSSQFEMMSVIYKGFLEMDNNPMNSALAQAGDLCISMGYNNGFPPESHADEYQYQDKETLEWKLNQLTELKKIYVSVIGASVEVLKNLPDHLVVTAREIENRIKGIKLVINE